MGTFPAHPDLLTVPDKATVSGVSGEQKLPEPRGAPQLPDLRSGLFV